MDPKAIMDRLLEGSWKTRLTGGAAILVVVCLYGLKYLAGADIPEDLLNGALALAAGLLGLGQWVARDDNVTSEDAGAKPRPRWNGRGPRPR